MGCQGEICVIYGVVVEGKCEWEVSTEGNPVVYSVNGHLISDEDEIEGFDREIEFWHGVPSECYGPNDMAKAELAIRVLGHSGWMGARHATKGLGPNAGRTCDVLVGYVTGSESYIDKASPLAPGEEVVAQAPRLIAEIKEKLGLDVAAKDLRAYLLFDSINGM